MQKNYCTREMQNELVTTASTSKGKMGSKEPDRDKRETTIHAIATYAFTAGQDASIDNRRVSERTTEQTEITHTTNSDVCTRGET